jgi:hypothetical protein
MLSLCLARSAFIQHLEQLDRRRLELKAAKYGVTDASYRSCANIRHVIVAAWEDRTLSADKLKMLVMNRTPEDSMERLQDTLAWNDFEKHGLLYIEIVQDYFILLSRSNSCGFDRHLLANARRRAYRILGQSRKRRFESH